jgi:hypothetical protein
VEPSIKVNDEARKRDEEERKPEKVFIHTNTQFSVLLSSNGSPASEKISIFRMKVLFGSYIA